MARLKANGTVIGTIYGIGIATRYMSNGAILINHGHGWKHKGKIKPEFNPQQAYERAKSLQESRLSERPAYCAFRAAMHGACGSLQKRSMLYAAIQTMPNDPDGVWSTVCDGWNGLDLELDEVSELCRLYQSAMKEIESVKRNGVDNAK